MVDIVDALACLRTSQLLRWYVHSVPGFLNATPVDRTNAGSPSRYLLLGRRRRPQVIRLATP